MVCLVSSIISSPGFSRFSCKSDLQYVVKDVDLCKPLIHRGFNFIFQPVRNLQFFFAKRWGAQNLRLHWFWIRISAFMSKLFKFKTYVNTAVLVMAGKKLTKRVCDCNLGNMKFSLWYRDCGCLCAWLWNWTEDLCIESTIACKVQLSVNVQ